MSLVLRPYQDLIVNEAREAMKSGLKSLLIVSPTGSGKTALTSKMLGSAAEKGLSSFFIVHRRELVKQSTTAFHFAEVPHGIIANGFPDNFLRSVQICSIGSLKSRLPYIKKPSLIIWDECHHLGAKSWENIFNAYPNAYHIGLSATPERLDGKGLKKFFQKIIMGPSVQDLIRDGWLSPYKLFAPPGVSMHGIHTRMGDFVKSELDDAIDKPKITGSAIEHYRKYAEGKRAVVFCVSIKHSKHVVEDFKAAGIAAEHVDGDTDSADRDAAIRRFQSGETLVLSNVELFGEGFDLPAIECAILLRPTQSLSMYLQQVGRALRPSPGKTHAVILDHAGNCARHGLPDDIREWSLEGREFREKNKPQDGPSVRICDRCFAAQFSNHPSCQFCGYEFEVKARVIEQADGELSEVNQEISRRTARAEQGKAESLDDLIGIGAKRGYRNPAAWASHIMKARQIKKLGRGI